jgi:DNA-binding Lrp family transcriptional regulator
MEQAVVFTKTLPEKIDRIDCQILNIFQEDCQLSFSKVANKAGISVGTAYNRIKSIEAKGVLKSYTARGRFNEDGILFYSDYSSAS